MTYLSMASNPTKAYGLEPDGRFIEVADAIMQEAHPAMAETIHELVDSALEQEEAEANDIDLKTEVG